jgi:aspartate racemase
MPTKQQTKKLGVLGGLGPLSAVYFLDLVVKHTKADKDQEHLDMLINFHCSTPDRTAFILGESDESPLSFMVEDINNLADQGCDAAVIICNTAHYFYDEVVKNVKIPVISLVDEGVKYAASKKPKKVGIIGTAGTIKTGLYQDMCKKYNLEYVIPTPANVALSQEIIYGEVKAGKSPGRNKFNTIVSQLEEDGCDVIILGCTELSLLKQEFNLPSYFVDPLQVLAVKVIEYCGKEAVGFEESASSRNFTSPSW